MQLVFGILVIAFAASVFFVNLSLGVFESVFFNTNGNEESKSFPVKSVTISIQELRKNVTAPVPLKTLEKAPQGVLSRQGVFKATNAQRVQEGLLPFSLNDTLSAIAEAKVNDMFDSQYFEHESPSGILFTDLAEFYKYEYLAMGENLALGYYKNDELLVAAWMDSPGHRENILNTTYQEIGIAVQKGLFENEEVWLAVQTFGLPLAACPGPSETTKNEIEFKQFEIQQLQGLLEKAKEAKEIKKFNELVDRHNQAVEEVQDLIGRYNEGVQKFNACANKEK
jgi:uncharacterized protein YkwD